MVQAQGESPFFAPDLLSEQYISWAYRCPSCGESYPLRGTCWGYGPDRHDPVQTERSDG
jgi:hypothetical protein